MAQSVGYLTAAQGTILQLVSWSPVLDSMLGAWSLLQILFPSLSAPPLLMLSLSLSLPLLLSLSHKINLKNSLKY